MTSLVSFVARFWFLAAALGVLALGVTPVRGEVVPPGTDAEISDRLMPFVSLCRAGDDCASSGATMVGASGVMTGEQVYNQFCFACHSTGVSESPLFGDADAWAPRIAKGMDVLWESTSNGLNLMPLRGTCMNCSDEELRLAMDYVIGDAL